MLMTMSVENAWMWLAILGLVALVAEIVVPGFVLFPVGIGMMLTAGVAYFVHHGVFILVALTLIEGLVFVLFRRWAHKFDTGPVVYTGAEGMLGKECVVVEEIPLGGMGYVKLYGDRWQAKSYSEEVLVPGRRVQIVKVEGNKVLVESID